MRRIGPILMIGLGILLILSTGAWLRLGDLTDHPGVVSLPGRIANLPLTSRLTGMDATQEFSMLHKKQFPLTSGAVGIYGEDQIELWAAGAPLNFIAAQMIAAMHDKISEGGSPFTGASSFQQGGRTIHALDGMGQKHFYFQSKNLVIWLSTEPNLADEALRQTLEAYP